MIIIPTKWLLLGVHPIFRHTHMSIGPYMIHHDSPFSSQMPLTGWVVGFSGLSDRGCLRATRRPVILGGFDKWPKGILYYITLWWTNKAIEAMAIEIVDFPIKNGWIFPLAFQMIFGSLEKYPVDKRNFWSSPSHCFSEPHLGMNPHLRPQPNPPTNCLLSDTFSTKHQNLTRNTLLYVFKGRNYSSLFWPSHMPGHQDMPSPETLKIYALPWDARQVWHPSCGNSFGSRPSQHWETRHEEVDSWGDLLEDWNTEVPTFPMRSPEVPCDSQTNLVADWGAADWSPERNFQTGALDSLDLGGDGSHGSHSTVVSCRGKPKFNVKGTLPKFVDSNLLGLSTLFTISKSA